MPTTNLSARRALTSVLVSGSLLLALAACSNTDNNNNEAQSSSSSASASTSSSSSSAASTSQSPSQSPTESTTTTSAEPTPSAEPEDNGPKPDENYTGAEKIKDAPTVAADSPEVKELDNLRSSYENTLAKVKPAPEPQRQQGDEEGSNDENGKKEQARQALDDDTIKAIEEMSTGAAAGEYTSSAAEHAMTGTHTEGTSTVVGNPRMTETTYKGQPARLLEVCVDSSNVKTVDKDGKELPSDNTPKRSLNIYTLVQVDGKWKIAEHDWPNNANC